MKRIGKWNVTQEKMLSNQVPRSHLKKTFDNTPKKWDNILEVTKKHLTLPNRNWTLAL